MVGNKDVLSRLSKKMELTQHMGLWGKAGTGKTTVAIILAKKYLGENFKDNFLELNASDERGIDVVRKRIKDFARSTPLGDNKKKVIFLDESDSLTSEAQSALRRTMEKYWNNCIFVMSGNYHRKVIEPIISRLSNYKFKPVSLDETKVLLQRIAEKEGLVVEDGVYEHLYKIAKGDLRRSVQLLEECSEVGCLITLALVRSIELEPDRGKVMKLIMMSSKMSQFKQAREILYDLVYIDGVSTDEILNMIYDIVLKLKIADDKRGALIEAIGDIDYRVAVGSNENIQMSYLLTRIANVFEGK